MELSEPEAWEVLWALLYWRAGCKENNRMRDVDLDALVERVRALIHHRGVF